MARSKPKVQKQQAPTLTKIRRAMKDNDYVWFTREYSVNIVGVRSKDLQANTFNDWMTVSWLDDAGMWFYRRWHITTDPGVYWRENPMNSAGTGILKASQYRGLWKLGMFRGAYEALVQAGNCTLWRDDSRDSTLELYGEEQTGRFGICAHRASINGSTKVGRWSAGCQVFADPNDFAEFLAIVKHSIARHGSTVSYTLLEEE